MTDTDRIREARELIVRLRNTRVASAVTCAQSADVIEALVAWLEAAEAVARAGIAWRQATVMTLGERERELSRVVAKYQEWERSQETGQP